MRGKPLFFLGAYAGYASLLEKTAEADAAYAEGLKDLPAIRGLELPFFGDGPEAPSDFPAFMKRWDPQWDILLTTLPGTMTALTAQPEVGLGSSEGAGRKAALALLKRARNRVADIAAASGRARVVAVEIHSSPRAPEFSAEAFAASAHEFLSWDWCGAELILEHCDAFRLDRTHSKGFQSLADDLALVQTHGLKLGLNWGRSVLDGRSAGAALEHIGEAGEALRSFFFSGTAAADPLYGVWQDNHSPLCLASNEPWRSEGSLLDIAAVRSTLQALSGSPDIYLGLKVQPAPASLSVSDRLRFLDEQLKALQAVADAVR